MLEFIEGFGPWAPLVVFFAAYSESAAFLGLVIPGETLMIAGGAAAAIGGEPLALVLGAAILGAILGDATGYLIGRRYGTSLLQRNMLQRFQAPVDKAGAFLEKHGWWALILARFLSMFRAVVPFAAGAAKMPYGRFAVGNISGSVLYGGAIAGFGYWAGSRWETFESIIRRGGLTLGGLVGMIAVIFLSSRWIGRNRAKVERLLSGWTNIPYLGAFLQVGVTSGGRVRPFMRILPQLAAGLAMTLGFILAGVIDWSFFEAAMIRRIQGSDPVVQSIAEGISSSITEPYSIAAIVIAAIFIGWFGRWRAYALIVAAPVVTWILAFLLNRQIDRPFGPVTLDIALPPNFPDVIIAVATAAILALAWPWYARWQRGATRIGMAAIVITILATARAVSISAYPVDVSAGVALGAAIVVAVGVLLDPKLRSKIRSIPQPRETGTALPPMPVPAPERPSF